MIRYEILKDGTCSYCGRVADLIELPDGDSIFSEICEICESDDLDEKAESIAYALELQEQSIQGVYDEF